MRRIPLSQRSIDPLPLLPRHTNPPSACRATLTPPPFLLRTTSASFSTTARTNSILSNDPKKHKAFVRKWQKRLLGDAEPIGAHVDPYDRTSPVRIAPEETGEELEVLEEEVENVDDYEPAEVDDGLKRVGGEKFLKNLEEDRLQERFEELVFPGRDRMVEYTFGPTHKITNHRELVAKFHQSVVEVYTLKEAGLPLDLASSAQARGWEEATNLNFSNVKLSLSPSNGLVLNYPTPEAKAQLLEAIQSGPSEREAESAAEEVDDLVDEADIEADAVQENIDIDASPSEAKPTIKETKGNPFDFMSNRGAPASQPEPIPSEPVQAFDVEAATEDIQNHLSEIRHSVLESAAQRSERAVAVLRSQVRGHMESLSSDSVSIIEPTISVPYGKFALADPAIKFAITKRLLQLTGHRLSDPTLNTTRTLSDLLSALISASKPKPTKLREAIRSENKLPRLQNVKVYRSAVDEKQRETEIGRWKVIAYALRERGLPVLEQDAPTKEWSEPTLRTGPAPRIEVRKKRWE